MKSLEELQNEQAQALVYDNWEDLLSNADPELINNTWYLVCLKYAEACQIACLEKASKNAKVKRGFVATSGKEVLDIQERFEPNAFSYTIDKESITSKANLV